MKKIFIFEKVLAFLFILLTTVSTCAQEFEFQALGILNNIGGASSNALDISSDGSVVTGITTSTYQGQSAGEAYRWENGIMTGIGFYNPSTDPSAMSYGTAISTDGTLIVGYARTMESQEGSWEAFLWMQGEGMMGLGGLTEPPYRSEARGVSDNGQVVVGRDFNSQGKGFRWANGQMVELTESNGYFIEAWGCSADGSVVVGSGFVDEGFNSQAVLWKEGEGMRGLGSPEEEFSRALSVSADGTVAVGSRNRAISEEEMYWEAFKWTEEIGMVGLGYLDNNRPDSEAKDVSDDGSVVVGYSSTDEGLTAFVWTEETGMLSIREILENNGIDLTGWKLKIANAVSADGKVIVGDGINPQGKQEAWRIVLPFIPTGGECTAPESFMLDEVSESTALFSWEPSPSEVNGYSWQVMNLGGIPGEDEPVTSGITEPGSTQAFAMGLAPNTSYNVYIQTRCNGGEQSDYAGPFMITTTGGGGECLSPTDITISTVTGSVVFISWTENGDASQWEIEYGETGFTQGEGTTILDNDGMPGEAIIGVEEGTDYDVYVRAICEFSGSEWVGPVTFNTEEMGINEFEKQFVLYPNPTTGIVNIQTKEKINSVSVYNAAGQKVSFNSLNKENTTIDISSLSGGIYFIELNLNNKTIKRYKVIRK